MQIAKIMVIDSPVHLFRLLRSREEIIDYSSGDVYQYINIFMDSTKYYLGGCKCEQEESYSDMMDQYRNSIIGRADVVSHLTNGFQCDRIEFRQ